MYSLEIPDTMSSAMAIIHLGIPEPPSCQDINTTSRDRSVNGPYQSLNIEISKEHPGIGLLLLWGWFSEVEGPGDIGGSIQILSSGVQQVDHVPSYLGVWVVFGSVVYDGGVASTRRDSVEAQALIVLLLHPALVNLHSSLVLSDAFQFGAPAPEACHSHSIPNMALPEAFLFFGIARSPVIADTSPLNGILERLVDMVVEVPLFAKQLAWERNKWIGLNYCVDRFEVFSYLLCHLRQARVPSR
jgi:hypothetical protein